MQANSWPCLAPPPGTLATKCLQEHPPVLATWACTLRHWPPAQRALRAGTAGWWHCRLLAMPTPQVCCPFPPGHEHQGVQHGCVEPGENRLVLWPQVLQHGNRHSSAGRRRSRGGTGQRGGGGGAGSGGQEVRRCGEARTDWLTQLFFLLSVWATCPCRRRACTCSGLDAISSTGAGPPWPRPPNFGPTLTRQNLPCPWVAPTPHLLVQVAGIVPNIWGLEMVPLQGMGVDHWGKLPGNCAAALAQDGKRILSIAGRGWAAMHPLVLPSFVIGGLHRAESRINNNAGSCPCRGAQKGPLAPQQCGGGGSGS